MKPYITIMALLLLLLLALGLVVRDAIRDPAPDIIPADRAALLITIDDPAKRAPVEYIALPRAAAADLLAAETIQTRNLENRPQRSKRGRFGCATLRP